MKSKLKKTFLWNSKPSQFFITILAKLRRMFRQYILRDNFLIELARWYADRGDETLRLDYPSLNKDSIVFDIGGYVGDFAYEINKKYGCKVYLFEPHPKYFSDCQKRFKNNHNIILLNYGVSDIDGEFELWDSIDGSSFHNEKINDKDSIKCAVKGFFTTIEELDIKHIDLIKINIEGSEYPLLEHISSQNALDIIDNYQIQFHNFINGASEKRDNIVNALKKTHERTWCYKFVWENWVAKKN